MKDAARAAREPALLLAGIEPAGVHETAIDEPAAILRTGAPAWACDAIAVSARVRALLATLRPIVVQVLTFWDHALRAVQIGARRLEVDPSGCYRRR